jgi:hypothetical protein
VRLAFTANAVPIERIPSAPVFACPSFLTIRRWRADHAARWRAASAGLEQSWLTGAGGDFGNGPLAAS